MSDAKDLYNHILRALALVLPRAVYQDVRRVRTLAWAMTGLCLTQRVQLSAWADITEARAKLAVSRIQRFSRWLHHPAIVPAQ